MDVNKLDVWLFNAFKALPTELACGVAPRDRVKGQQGVSRFFWNLNSVDWDEALLSGSYRKHPHFITKIVLVSQKKNKDICEDCPPCKRCDSQGLQASQRHIQRYRCP